MVTVQHEANVKSHIQKLKSVTMTQFITMCLIN